VGHAEGISQQLRGNDAGVYARDGYAGDCRRKRQDPDKDPEEPVAAKVTDHTASVLLNEGPLNQAGTLANRGFGPCRQHLPGQAFGQQDLRMQVFTPHFPRI